MAAGAASAFVVAGSPLPLLLRALPLLLYAPVPAFQALAPHLLLLLSLCFSHFLPKFGHRVFGFIDYGSMEFLLKGIQFFYV